MIKIDQFFDPESTTNQLTINFSTTFRIQKFLLYWKLKHRICQCPKLFFEKDSLTDPAIRWFQSPFHYRSRCPVALPSWLFRCGRSELCVVDSAGSTNLPCHGSNHFIHERRQKWCTKHKTKLFLYSYWSYWNGQYWAGTPSLRSWLEEALDAMPRTEYVSVESQHLTACHRLSQWFPAGLRTL